MPHEYDLFFFSLGGLSGILYIVLLGTAFGRILKVHPASVENQTTSYPLGLRWKILFAINGFLGITFWAGLFNHYSWTNRWVNLFYPFGIAIFGWFSQRYIKNSGLPKLNIDLGSFFCWPSILAGIVNLLFYIVMSLFPSLPFSPMIVPLYKLNLGTGSHRLGGIVDLLEKPGSEEHIISPDGWVRENIYVSEGKGKNYYGEYYIYTRQLITIQWRVFPYIERILSDNEGGGSYTIGVNWIDVYGLTLLIMSISGFVLLAYPLAGAETQNSGANFLADGWKVIVAINIILWLILLFELLTDYSWDDILRYIAPAGAVFVATLTCLLLHKALLPYRIKKTALYLILPSLLIGCLVSPITWPFLPDERTDGGAPITISPDGQKAISLKVYEFGALYTDIQLRYHFLPFVRRDLFLSLEHYPCSYDFQGTCQIKWLDNENLVMPDPYQESSEPKTIVYNPGLVNMDWSSVIQLSIHIVGLVVLFGIYKLILWIGKWIYLTALKRQPKS